MIRHDVTQSTIGQSASGQTIGAYRIISLIGQGGMGEVWLAEHTLLGRRAAIKVLRPNLSANAEMVTRFFNEARAAAVIADPGIVQVFDFGHHSDGSAYLVMELLDGESLDKRLNRIGRFAVGDALRALRQVASSLGAAHARQIVHRDLKPENIFLVRDPEVASGERAKVLDFGIAKLSGDAMAMLTQTSTLMGTPMYMSPEQCRGLPVDQRCDVYSLGCVLFTLIAGRPPFEANGIGDMIAKHLLEPPPLLSSFVRGIQPEVDALIVRCMAKAAADRYANGSELASAIDELRALASRTPVAITIPPSLHPGLQATMLPSRVMTGVEPGGQAAPGIYTTLSGSAAATSPPTPIVDLGRRHPLQIVGIAGAVVAASVVAGWVAMRVSSRPSADGGGNVANAPVGSSHDVARGNPSTASQPLPPARAPEPNKDTDPRPHRAKQQLVAVLGGFRRWSAAHAGAECPSSRELASFVRGIDGGLDDPWGNPIKVTCTDQPATQIIGVISYGPDGVAGSRDDLESWNLGPDVTDLVRGERWKPPHVSRGARPSAVPAPHPVQPARSPQASEPAPKPRDPFAGTKVGGDGIPTSR